MCHCMVILAAEVGLKSSRLLTVTRENIVVFLVSDISI